MSTTVISEKFEIVLPKDVCEQADVHAQDRVEWRFEAGEIRGRKVDSGDSEMIDFDMVDPHTLLPKTGRITAASILASVRADRDRRM